MTTDITDMVSNDLHIYSNEKKSNHVGILKSISKWNATQTRRHQIAYSLYAILTFLLEFPHIA